MSAKQVHLTPQQLAVVLVYESAMQHLTMGAQQMEFVGLKAEAATLTKTLAGLNDAYKTLQRQWETGLVLATATGLPDVPRVIP